MAPSLWIVCLCLLFLGDKTQLWAVGWNGAGVQGQLITGATSVRPAQSKNSELGVTSDSFTRFSSSALLVAPSRNAGPGFTLLGPVVTGVQFSNILSAQAAAENQIRLNGSGVAAGDVDGDGRCDLFFCGLQTPSKLYRNLGNWTFQDITAEAGLGTSIPFSTGAILADLDNDGDLDLLINSIGGGTHCFLNDGKGRFSEKLDSGLVKRFGAMSMTLADVDGDGDLDLYVTNYRTTTIRSTGFSVLNVAGKRFIRPDDRDRLEYSPEGLILEMGEPDFFYLNDGYAKFIPVPWTGGRFLDEMGKTLKSTPREWGLSAMFRDWNGDGLPDLYVCNDFQSSDRMWLNDGQGHFRLTPSLALRNSATFSMCVDFADINRDGYDDFFVADMLDPRHGMAMREASRDSNRSRVGAIDDRPQFNRNVLQIGRGDGSFSEIACFAGLEATGWTWGAAFLDVDLDGYEDLLVTTGHMFNTQDLDANARIDRGGPYPPEKIPQKLLMYPPHSLPKRAFRNRGDLTFEEVGAAWGFNQEGISHGLCLADLDNDGDLDVVVNNLNAPVGLYRNESAAPRLAVRLRGERNTRGIGARIKVFGGPVPMQSQEMISGGRYLSSDDAMRAFAAGTNRMSIEVTWRSGKTSALENAECNRLYEIPESSAQSSASSKASAPASLFEDASASLGHSHVDEEFDDFERQPLLPRKLSQLGPGVAWIDLNHDGFDDLLIGSGRGGEMSLFLNRPGQGFERQSIGNATRDQTAIVGWPQPDGSVQILAGSANFEDRLAAGASVRSWNPETRIGTDLLAGQPASTGPIALGDMDGDGLLELFVGGRVLPGRYPEAASSKLYRLTQNRWLEDPRSAAALQDIGLVSGAVWSDLDGDGLAELIVACEWGQIKIFTFKRGQFIESTQDWGLAAYSGWWNGIAVGDFNGDGKMDLVASNWGENFAPSLTRKWGERIFFGDLDGNGTLDLVQAIFDEGLRDWVPEFGLDALSASVPALRDRFASHESYSTSTVTRIIGGKPAKMLEAKWFSSVLFLNEGHSFKPVALPIEAQWAPAFGIGVGDFDGDGHEDMILAQNFSPVHPLKSRLDAGRGLLLKGDGTGLFEAVPGQRSGVLIYGEQRGCAVADFDGDARLDVVVTQNGNATKLLRNRGGKPGLRVKLAGPSGNPRGFGAQIRLSFGARSGPARQVSGGGGYWSQDASTLILASDEDAVSLQALWPGGRRTTTALPKNTREITVRFDGTQAGSR